MRLRMSICVVRGWTSTLAIGADHQFPLHGVVSVSSFLLCYPLQEAEELTRKMEWRAASNGSHSKQRKGTPTWVDEVLWSTKKKVAGTPPGWRQWYGTVIPKPNGVGWMPETRGREGKGGRRREGQLCASQGRTDLDLDLDLESS